MNESEELVEIPLSKPTPDERNLIDAVTSATLWRAEADELLSQVRALEEESDYLREHLLERLVMLHRECDSLRAENASLKAEVERLKDLSEQVLEEKEQLRAKLTKAERERDGLRKFSEQSVNGTVQEILRERDFLRQQLAVSQSLAERLQSESETLQKEYDLLLAQWNFAVKHKDI